MIDIVSPTQEQVEQARYLIPADHAEPDWKCCKVVVEDGSTTGIIGGGLKLCVEPLYIKRGHYAAAMMAFGYADGVMSKLAEAYGLGGYEFHILDVHPEFQLFAAKHFPVTPGKERPGLYFFRSFANGKNCATKAG